MKTDDEHEKRLATLEAQGYTVDDDGIWWSNDHQHCFWVEREAGRMLIVIGDDQGMAQAYMDPKVLQALSSAPKSFLVED